ncbi:ABC transporter permease [Candidatus Bipolaricaulota bacterium]
MLSYVVRRILIAIPVLLGITFITFAIVNFAPGDPISMMLMGNEHLNPDLADSLREFYGLNQPWYVQYATYMGNLLRGNLGVSIASRTSIASSIRMFLPNTMLLAFSSMLLALVVAIPIGIISATRRNSLLDYGSLTIALFGVSMPSFWLGLMLMLLFGLRWRVLPVYGMGDWSNGPWDVIRHLILPSITLGAGMAALLVRLTRASMLQVLSEDYVRTARAKGLRASVVLYKHGLRNGLLPVVTAAGLQFGRLLGGAFIVESIFAWPGMGKYTLYAIGVRDYPVIQATTLVFALSFVVVTLLVDVAYTFIDPRIRYD